MNVLRVQRWETLLGCGSQGHLYKLLASCSKTMTLVPLFKYGALPREELCVPACVTHSWSWLQVTDISENLKTLSWLLKEGLD